MEAHLKTKITVEASNINSKITVSKVKTGTTISKTITSSTSNSLRVREVAILKSTSRITTITKVTIKVKIKVKEVATSTIKTRPKILKESALRKRLKN
jgi:hypothetical protein